MINKNLALLILVVFAAGCGMEAKTYVMTKDRVGYDAPGNGGCVVGKCPPALGPAEKTRKIYVLELTKPVSESEVKKIEEKTSSVVNTSLPPSSPLPQASEPAVQTHHRVIPVIEDEPVALPAAVAEQNMGKFKGGETYTIQKDDTLQKISKKVFGTYSKWYKIYKANKNKIKNPNVLIPGTVINIPELK
ncbi:MAG: LysM peptidoglycan-binding domain-containing protein [Candidatus Omnitrophica bacterium]|nr:LysM peptidoglycan-binding domain-containing protein [Candidatus Omnitrophota bacterium]